MKTESTVSYRPYLELAVNYRQYLPSDYRKRHVAVSHVKAPHTASVNSYWSGGSRSHFTLFPKGAGHGLPVSKEPGFPFANQTIELQAGDVLVETGIFCGKTGTAHILFVE